MNVYSFAWHLSHAPERYGEPMDTVKATVPGAVQLDYAEAFGYPPYYYGTNFRLFDWMEDEFFFYDTSLDFKLEKGERAILCFDSIDYRYEIAIDGKAVYSSEGIFTPVRLDVSEYGGSTHSLRVTLFPVPKRYSTPKNRSQASASCKPPSSYGWDWHPRLIPTGLIGDAYLDIVPKGAPRGLEASYRLSDDLSYVTVFASVECCGGGELCAELISPRGDIVASCTKTVLSDTADFELTVASPLLWYPRGYGDQPLYTLSVRGAETVTRKIGFRRTRLVLNEGANIFEAGFPKGPRCAPMQLEINGKRIFAKGSNWVNTEIFPSLATKSRYDELLDLAYDANMNILRMWGGQYINHNYFYEKCDELGIMIWQEFMLSCNDYPDTDEYLKVLRSEAVSIVRALRLHPCIAMWCGGNELFNSWSGMTQQSHALRLLDSVCYEEDRYTPFNMTSPLYGLAHGSYVKAVFPSGERSRGDFSHGHEFICDLKRARATGYTEFGCNGASPRDYILKYVMDEDTYYNNCNEGSDIWVSHHAFRAWNESCWLGIPEVCYYFGGYDGTDDLVDKSIYLQDICYKTMFEEMRRQAPLCSMAINWDFNEPWPSAAGNSLVNWPAEPKSALCAVKEALRPTLLSLELPRNRYLSGETLTATVWLLNDRDTEAPPTSVSVYLNGNNGKELICKLDTAAVAARKNSRFGSFQFEITDELPERFSISLESDGHKDWYSVYDLVHNRDANASRSIDSGEPIDDAFSDFLK